MSYDNLGGPSIIGRMVIPLYRKEQIRAECLAYIIHNQNPSLNWVRILHRVEIRMVDRILAAQLRASYRDE